MDLINQWLGAIALAISIGSALYAWLTSGSRHNAEAVTKVTERLDGQEQRLGLIEAEWKHLPDKESVNRLELAMVELKGQITGLSKESEGTHRALLRMEDYLLKAGGRQ